MLNTYKVPKGFFCGIKSCQKHVKCAFHWAEMTFILVSKHIWSFPKVSYIFRNFKIIGSCFLLVQCTWISKIQVICTFQKNRHLKKFLLIFVTHTMGLGSIVNVHGNVIWMCSKIRNLFNVFVQRNIVPGLNAWFSPRTKYQSQS